MISIYVGNLPYDTTEPQLVELFSHYGQVNRAALVNDRETGRPRGFGFVEMPNRDEALKAIEALGGADFNGRPLTVNEARRNTGRNTANLSRSAQRAADPPPTESHGSAGYAARTDKPPATPPDPAPDTGDAGHEDDPPATGSYRNTGAAPTQSDDIDTGDAGDVEDHAADDDESSPDDSDTPTGYRNDTAGT